MKIIIIKNGQCESKIMKYLPEFCDAKIINSYDTNFDDEFENNYDAVIILGGPQYVSRIHDYPYLLNVVKFIDRCYHKGVHVLGICLGMHLIAHSIGLQVSKLDDSLTGYVSIDELCFRYVFRSHYEHVIIPDDYDKKISTYYHDNVLYYFKHNTLTGIQMHPDIDPLGVSNFTNSYTIMTTGYYNKHIIAEDNYNFFFNYLKSISVR